MEKKFDELDPIYTPNFVTVGDDTPTEANLNETHQDETNLSDGRTTQSSDTLNIQQPKEIENHGEEKTYDPLNQTIPITSSTTPEPGNRSGGDKRRKTRSFPRMVASFLIFTFLGGLVFGAGYGTALYLGDQLTPALVQDSQREVNFSVTQYEPIASEGTLTTADANETVVEYQSIIPAIAELASPSVVTVTSQLEYVVQGFYGSRIYENEGTGSGIIYKLTDTDLLIITNYHVIDSAQSLDIIFYDGTTLAANVVGFDSQRDLAVLSIPLTTINQSDLEEIVVPTFGDSEALKPGELAVAIGSPLGVEYSSSVTAGVISALNRSITIDGITLDVLQTDAAINPGNSGGALVDHNGFVIGINTAKTDIDSVEGMGFAIPIHLALPIIEDIVEHGGEQMTMFNGDEKPFLGIRYGDVSDEIFESTGMPYGVYVGDVIIGSAAEAAGIEAGDIIYSIDSEPIKNSDDLLAYLSDKSPGDTLEIKIARGDEFIVVEATLTSYNDVITNE